MTAPLTSRTVRRETEVAYGNVMAGAIANGTWDIQLDPGIWIIALILNGTATGTPTLAAGVLDSAGNLSSPVQLVNGGTANATVALQTVTSGIVQLSPEAGTAVPASPGIPVLSAVRLTIANITGGNQRIDYVASRI
jgi:hypothetical protein